MNEGMTSEGDYDEEDGATRHALKDIDKFISSGGPVHEFYVCKY